MAVTRYNIIRLEVDRPGQIIRFQHKIPSYLKRCTGFKAVHVRGATKDVEQPEIGWFTASFNSLKEEAIVAGVSCPASTAAAENPGFQMLDVELRAGQLLVGVYVDRMKAASFMPYVVSLYLRCVDMASKVAAPKADQLQEKVRTEQIIVAVNRELDQNAKQSCSII